MSSTAHLSNTANLLVEIFVEELPPKALQKLGDAFADTLLETLRASDLAFAASLVTAYATPRRLAARVTEVASAAADQVVAQKLMPVAVGLDASGNPTPALVKKLAALGLDAQAVLPSLRRVADGKTENLFYDNLQRGATLAEGLQKALDAALGSLPIPKVMSYQLADGWRTVHFVRPAHGLVALHGENIVPVSVLGLHAGNTTHGHRFEAAAEPIMIESADAYAATLRDKGAVIASFIERRAEIALQLTEAATQAGMGLYPAKDEALLDEVTALVERPKVLIGRFEPEFLAVPQECLILTMKANQKYFPLLDADGKLTNQFLIVSNLSPADPAAIIGGNERVVRPRLADARFFFEQDQKKTLASRIAGLDKVVYHNRLGSQGERSKRVAAIAVAVAGKLGGEAGAVQEAARLAKADLLTDMVGEFPELQGVMGRYYARRDGLPEAVADAIEDHYKPRFAGDALPRGQVGRIVALADKLETLAGLFGIGQTPTGDKDPFGLRRHALGVIRLLLEGGLDLPLDALLETAEAQFSGAPGFAPASSALSAFIFERLFGLLREQGYTAEEVDAVLSLRPQYLADIPKRLAAVREFSNLPEAQTLAAANKRVGNILKKSEGVALKSPDPALFREPAESALLEALTAITPKADAAFAKGDYAASLQTLAALRAPVDAFFDMVMVNAEDPALRANRLNLLAQLRAAMNQVADLSRLF
ncbi:MAG: glycine--tRNA ligase subunit beta [Zoogloeaceae bacterium]|jgi:glycyl-tRNA synthetase beta chain|nr:glycine--tRNA ligase subunit beta [Zoogloeaceae bacterium]